MTKRRGKVRKPTELVLNLGPIAREDLDACARIMARLAVSNALEELDIDTDPATGDNVGNQHKAAPSGALTPNEAKERVT